MRSSFRCTLFQMNALDGWREEEVRNRVEIIFVHEHRLGQRRHCVVVGAAHCPKGDGRCTHTQHRHMLLLGLQLSCPIRGSHESKPPHSGERCPSPPPRRDRRRRRRHRRPAHASAPRPQPLRPMPPPSLPRPLARARRRLWKMTPPEARTRPRPRGCSRLGSCRCSSNRGCRVRVSGRPGTQTPSCRTRTPTPVASRPTRCPPSTAAIPRCDTGLPARRGCLRRLPPGWLPPLLQSDRAAATTLLCSWPRLWPYTHRLCSDTDRSPALPLRSAAARSAAGCSEAPACLRADRDRLAPRPQRRSLSGASALWPSRRRSARHLASA